VRAERRRVLSGSLDLETYRKLRKALVELGRAKGPATLDETVRAIEEVDPPVRR
jgi:hypothetical protein